MCGVADVVGGVATGGLYNVGKAVTAGTNSSDEVRDATGNIMSVGVDPRLAQQQQDFVAAMQAQMNGTGPSVSANMLQQQAAQNAANAQSMAQGQRGVNAGLAQRNAMNAGAQANAQAAQQATIGRNQEMLNAQQMLGGQLNTMQNQYVGVQQANQNRDLAKAGMISSAENQSAANNAGMLGGLLNAAGGAGAAMASDERVKTNIQDGSQDAYQFLDSLSPHKYEYKNPGAPGQAPGPQLGVMAQDIEKTAPQMIQNTPNGKMVDSVKAVGPQLAALSDLHERLKQLEGKAVKMADGGVVSPQPLSYEKFLTAPIAYKAAASPDMSGMSALGGGPASATGQMLAGGPMDNMGAGAQMPMAPMVANQGALVPGKAKVKGDSIKNDTVDAKLSPGEIVLPRTVVNAKNPGKAAMDFVNAIMAKSSMKSKGKAK